MQFTCLGLRLMATSHFAPRCFLHGSVKPQRQPDWQGLKGFDIFAAWVLFYSLFQKENFPRSAYFIHDFYFYHVLPAPCLPHGEKLPCITAFSFLTHSDTSNGRRSRHMFLAWAAFTRVIPHFVEAGKTDGHPKLACVPRSGGAV